MKRTEEIAMRRIQYQRAKEQRRWGRATVAYVRLRHLIVQQLKAENRRTA